MTYAGRKGFEDPETGVAMKFEAVIDHLRAKAASLEKAENGRFKIDVVAIDLRDP